MKYTPMTREQLDETISELQSDIKELQAVLRDWDMFYDDDTPDWERMQLDHKEAGYRRELEDKQNELNAWLDLRRDCLAV